MVVHMEKLIKFQKAIKQAGMTQEELASELGYTAQTISNWICRARQVRPEDARRVLERFPGLEWSDLYPPITERHIKGKQKRPTG